MNLENSFFWEISFSGLFVILGTWLSYLYQKHITKKDEEAKINSILLAVKIEISTLWNRYNKEMGPLIESLEGDTGLNTYYPVFDDYFVIYNNNTEFIGNIDKELGALIIKTYIVAKGLKDSLLFNNQLLNKFQRYYDLAEESNLDHYSKQHINCHETWKNYGQSLKKAHFELKDIANKLLISIDKKLLSQK